MRRIAILFFSFSLHWVLMANAGADEIQQQQLLAETVPKDNVVWLELDSKKSLAIYRRSTAKNSRGTVVLLKNSAGNAAVVDELAESLPPEGWHTLLVFTPPTADAEGLKRLDAALQFLAKGQADNLVLVVADRNAPLLTLLLKDKPAPPALRKILLLDAVTKQGDITQSFMERLDPTMFVLDIVLATGEQGGATVERIALAKQRSFAHYQMLDWAAMPVRGSGEMDWLVKRIEAWLKKS